RDPALIPGLHHHVATRNRNQRAVMRNAVLEARLRSGQLVVSLKLHLVVHDVEDRVRSPLPTVSRTALRLATAAPFVGEQDLRSVVVERRRVPVREIRIGNGGQADGMRGISNVEQETVPFARTTSASD